MGYSPWGHKESGTTERLNRHKKERGFGSGVSLAGWLVNTASGNSHFSLSFLFCKMGITLPHRFIMKIK